MTALLEVEGLVKHFVAARSVFGRLVPEGKNAEFFGFFNMMGKFATVLGPLLIAIVVTKSYATIFPHVTFLATAMTLQITPTKSFLYKCARHLSFSSVTVLHNVTNFVAIKTLLHIFNIADRRGNYSGWGKHCCAAASSSFDYLPNA